MRFVSLHTHSTFSYGQRHERVRKARGPASEHLCADCGSDAQEWATIHGRDGSEIEDYRPLCCACHGRYDDHWSAETRAKVSATLKRLKIEDPSMHDSLKGNMNAVGKRTPEQIERMRIARWGR